METGEIAGYREIEHTADWELEVWAPDLTGLLEQAALGMYSLADITLQPQPRIRKSFELTALDEESLLVDFLNELLWYGEDMGLAFDEFDLTYDRCLLCAEIEGGPIAFIGKEIKAATFHDLKIRRGARGLEARVVFDV